MKQPINCKWCSETEFRFHDKLFIYSPDLDEEELIENVYECLNCNTYYFEIEGLECMQISKSVVSENTTPKLDNYMKS